MADDKGHPRFAAFLDWSTKHEGRTMRNLRRDAAARVQGRVLELGVGVGANWPHLPSDADYMGIEPDPHVLARARKRASELGRDFSLQQARAEELPFEDESFDTVLVTLTLCTVQDPALALTEARRVLKPGGQLVFVEHVRPEGRARGWLFDRITPLWRRVGAGCHPNRGTEQAIRDAHFEIADVRRKRMLGLPLIAGTAEKPT